MAKSDLSVGVPEGDDLRRLQRRLQREQKARQEAEAIAERVTSELYTNALELARLNEELGAANEELQSLNQAMRDFVAVASHDLRGPLTSILGWSSTMVKKWESIADEDKREYLTVIQENSRHLNRMIEDLLTISRIESGALETQAKVVEFRSAVDEVIKGFMEHSDEISLMVPDCLRVLVDPDHLNRMLTNFVTNALKYGEPPVEVEARQEDGWVEIRVRDLGRGVPPDFVPQLFGKFARANDPSTRGKKGTGLGLSIVRGLARANGGETWYEPNQPHGSCFAVKLPAAAA